MIRLGCSLVAVIAVHGYRDGHGINYVNHLGVKTLRFEYQDLR